MDVAPRRPQLQRAGERRYQASARLSAFSVCLRATLHEAKAHWQRAPASFVAARDVIIPAPIPRCGVGPDGAGPDFAAAAANAAVVLWADQLPAETLAEMAGRARLRCVGAIAGQVPELSLLRAHLTQPDGWPDCVVAWTRRRYGDLQHDVAKVLRVAAQRALTDRTVTRVVAMSGSKPWTVYRRFSASGTGPPAAWFQAIRATAMAMAIQREIELPIQRFAVRFGYAASDSLSQRLWRILGSGPIDPHSVGVGMAAARGDLAQQRHPEPGRNLAVLQKSGTSSE